MFVTPARNEVDDVIVALEDYEASNAGPVLKWRVAAGVCAMERCGRYLDIFDESVQLDMEQMLEEVVDGAQGDVEIMVVDFVELGTKHLQDSGTTYRSFVPAHEGVEGLTVVGKPRIV